MIDLFAWIPNDAHNVLALLVRAMNAHEDDCALQYLATNAMHTYMRIMKGLEDVQQMADCAVHEVESAILASMY